MSDCCCLGCEERVIGCHSTCEKYKAFKERLRQISKTRWERTRNNIATISMQKSMTDKIKKGRKNK